MCIRASVLIACARCLRRAVHKKTEQGGAAASHAHVSPKECMLTTQHEMLTDSLDELHVRHCVNVQQYRVTARSLVWQLAAVCASLAFNTE